MLPRLGGEYQLEIEYVSQPQAAYMTDEWFERDLPAAPAIMVGEDIAVEGGDISDDRMEAIIRKALGLPDAPRRGLLSRLLGG